MVCTKENGQQVNTHTLDTIVRQIRVALNNDFHFHSLRHAHATLLLENGANIKDIQNRLGHSQLSTTMDTYSHVTDKMKNETVDIFEKLQIRVCHPKYNTVANGWQNLIYLF